MFYLSPNVVTAHAHILSLLPPNILTAYCSNHFHSYFHFIMLIFTFISTIELNTLRVLSSALGPVRLWLEHGRRYLHKFKWSILCYLGIVLLKLFCTDLNFSNINKYAYFLK